MMYHGTQGLAQKGITQMVAYQNQLRIQDFPGGRQSEGGVPTYFLAKICRKLHKIWPR